MNMNSMLWKTAIRRAVMPGGGIRSIASTSSLSTFKRRTEISILARQGYSLTARGNQRPSRSSGKQSPVAVATRSAASDSSNIAEQTTTAPARHDDPHDYDLTAQMKREISSIVTTFSWTDSPRDAKLLGLAGVLPYLGISVLMAFLSREVNTAMQSGKTAVVSPDMIDNIMNVMEPTQIGHGVVILSFLSAINWGFQWSRYGGAGGLGAKRNRYLPGVLTPALAWSTLYMPFETALMTQFLGFVLLYNADAKKSTLGLAPPWYANYRWVLTFVVGLSILTTLISREELMRRQFHPSSQSYLQANKELMEGMLKRVKGERKPEDRTAGGLYPDSPPSESF